jgi:serine/threonine protein kinase
MKLHESIDTLDKIYLVVEFLEGTSLAKHLSSIPENKFSTEAVLKVLKQLMLAVDLL